ncbi:hypothetical protein SAMN05421819_2877 [Bryocella elongata]|uniref:Ribonuclease VapC n=1 Tax=Bryocella elongata TaxID=863522 RepID=A0A1H6A3F9_9BACT|nr:TA system VapC family ribonuclease toxin [Bryocella elongata]SEG42764.1 hypothetical protein SAMN05421819_2877 [Bryocella elongata]
MILPDANVWFSLSTSGHASHTSTAKWLQSVASSERIFFCRLTQLSLLRLLTTSQVMGDDVMTQRSAWLSFDFLMLDPRIELHPEPEGLSIAFRNQSNRNEVSPKRWADDYLAAFANAGGLQLVTYDRALAARVQGACLLTP